MTSFAKTNIEKNRLKKRSEIIKLLLEHFFEALCVIGIFLLGFGIIIFL